MNRRQIRLNIEELVLHGFSESEAQCIRETAEAELTRLLSEGNLSSSQVHTGTISSLNVGRIQIYQNATPRTIGSQIARSIYGGLTK